MKRAINLIRKSDQHKISLEISAAWDDIQAFAAMYSFTHGEEYFAIDAETSSMGKYAVA